MENSNNEVSGFLQARGQKLINGNGQEIILRGVGFGSWMLPEGYMWLFPDQGDRPRRIEKMIEDLVGVEKAEQFWEIYYDRYTAEADIRQIAANGFNSVRVPINARFLISIGEDESVSFIQKNVQRMDSVIAWCREHRLYVILDLHGATGGQTGTNIDDSENDQPELFMNERNKQITIELWRMLAERYKDEWIVAGYDLLNEPLPNWFSAYNDQVMPLYREITKAIRKVDNRHMIILEGVHWASDWSIFDEMFDDNLMLQFHKYWNNPDTESIQTYLDQRVKWNVPIFMGEGGENNKEWYAGAFRLFEDHNISWNFWTWKKMGKNNSPCSVIIPEGWQLLVDYLQVGTKPDEETAKRILWEYLHNISFEQCVYYDDVVNALFRRAPTHIPAIFYGYGGENVGYGVSDRMEGTTGFRIQDGTDIQFIESSRVKANFEHSKGEPWQPDERLCVQLLASDWVAYDFTVGAASQTSDFTIDLRVCAPKGSAKFAVTVAGHEYETMEVSLGSWQTLRLPHELQLSPGLHHIVVTVLGNSLRLEWLEVKVVND
ncbi:glycoside hydrolase family 5 protein [Paenibacillus psychroresistens]|uniref:Glycoside hydrolase family 5 protein n=1 Tax=Paenibacillus psychroresistens TaxID=1778678 RepID=A0A6B8RCU6_9BACL|nr:cellulase family glycosylhydrolase [Paenibacillus psychroresistens]QGQ93990.1 glycoside hydrolase family 5 protein [Paenibacillus psychroresistens]